MGAIVLRGTRSAPRVYGQYVDHDGVRRTRLLRGARTKAEARPLLAQIELRVAAGSLGMPEDGAAREVPTVPAIPTTGPLMRRWLGGLENRNALLDRQRAQKHLLPVWEEEPMQRAQQLPGCGALRGP